MEMTKFRNEKFGEIRTAEINGEIWFVGKDVAAALGYERATKAIADHVDGDDIDEVPIQDSIGRLQKTPVINESGLYSLILSSKLETAKEFKRWVTSEVLPSIRRAKKKMEMTIEIRKENGFNAVSARELHEKLEITDRFNRWFERMVAYGFVENEDFTSVKSSTLVNNGAERELQDYAITLDMAKEICMIQRSDTGRKFRQYFIECEKELNRKIEACSVPRVSKEELEARKKEAEAKSKEYNLGVYDRLHSLANEYAEKSEAYRQVLDAHATKALAGEFLLPLPETEKTYSATEIGDMLGISANRVGKIANANGMKTAEFGKYFIDKSKFSAKEVQTFRYNSRAVGRIRQLLGEAE